MYNHNKIGRVYMITNHVNGRVYVGKTTYTIEERFEQHVTGTKLLISKEIRKYGRENFTIECLEDNIPADIILDKEKYYIELHEDRCYNKYVGKDYHTIKKRKTWNEFTDEQKEQHRQSNQEWRSRNRKKESDRVMAYYWKHREEVLRKQREHYHNERSQ